MTGGSQQLRLFRRAIRDGATLEEACAATGNIISETEGRIYLAADAANPPPPEAFELLYDPTQKETTMAKEDGNEVGKVNGEYAAPDAKAAFKHHREHIAPKLTQIDTLRGECSEPWQHIKKHTHMPRPVMNFLINLQNIDDDAKQQHHIDALFDGLAALNLTRSRDMFSDGDAAEDDGLPSIDEDEDFEASAEELAQQAPRAEVQAKKASVSEMKPVEPVTAH
jgi:hypothetical protein